MNTKIYSDYQLINRTTDCRWDSQHMAYKLLLQHNICDNSHMRTRRNRITRMPNDAVATIIPIEGAIINSNKYNWEGGQAYGVTNGKQMHLEGFIINNMQPRNNFTAARQIQITIQHHKWVLSACKHVHEYVCSERIASGLLSSVSIKLQRLFLLPLRTKQLKYLYKLWHWCQKTKKKF